MKRAALLLGLLLWLPGLVAEAEPTAPAAVALTPAQLLRQVDAAIVAIRVTRQPGSEAVTPPNMDLYGPIEDAHYFQRPAGCSSGVVIDAAGYILTSNYNVTGGVIETVEVQLADGNWTPATVLGRHENWDIALLKVEKELQDK